VPVRVPSPTLHIYNILKLKENYTVGADEVRHDLLNANISYAHLDKCTGRDDFLLTNPLHHHLFSRLTHYLLSASLLVAMDNRRTRGVNITTLPSEILDIVAPKLANTLPHPLNDILSLRRL
jgi:hypothetical protein